MPMENIKQQLSDVVHHWMIIIMVTLFLFPVQPAEALTVKPAPLTQAQLKQEKLLKMSTAKYTHKQQLGDKELLFLLKAVGFQGEALKKAWSIVKRESNGRPLAYNGNRKTGDSSYGMFQINMIGELGPDRREKFDLSSNAELFNPVTNAQVALHMTKSGTDWSSWSSLNGKRYQEWYNKYPCKK